MPSSPEFRIFITSLILILAVLTAAAAQSVAISFVDGDVTVHRNGAELEARIGDSLEADDVLKLQSGSSMELDLSGSRIYLNMPGNYSVKDLMQGSGQSDGTDRGVLGGLSRRIQSLKEDNIRTDNTQGGTRAKAVDISEIEWAGDSTEEIWADAFQLLSMGDDMEAYRAFQEAYDQAEPGLLDEATYYLGYSAALLGRYDEATDLYSQVTMTPDSGDLYYFFLLSRADIDLRTGKPASALKYCDEVIRDSSLPPAQVQLAEYQKALALNGLGKTGESRAALQRVVNNGSDPALTSLAKDLLE